MIILSGLSVYCSIYEEILTTPRFQGHLKTTEDVSLYRQKEIESAREIRGKKTAPATDRKTDWKIIGKKTALATDRKIRVKERAPATDRKNRVKERAPATGRKIRVKERAIATDRKIRGKERSIATKTERQED